MIRASREFFTLFFAVTILRMVHAFMENFNTRNNSKEKICIVEKNRVFFYFNSYLSVIVKTNFNLHRTSAM